MNIVDSSAKSNMSISAFLISHLMREIVFRQQAGAGLALVHNQSVCTNILIVFVFPLYPFCIEHIREPDKKKECGKFHTRVQLQQKVWKNMVKMAYNAF